MADAKTAIEVVEGMIRHAKDAVEPYKPEWAERRETAKALISLSSAALIFTITFSASIIKPDTSRVWRYSLLVCWVAFICSLACSLGSLWFSMGLASLPILVEEKTNQIVSALNSALQDRARGSEPNPDPAVTIFVEQLNKVAKDDQRVYWLLRASLCFFGLALLTLSAVGVRQLLY